MSKEIRIETIDSGSELSPPFDFHFKITAGPGAGKTFWLTRHIRNVIKNTELFSQNPVVKIACITYTNTATEEIKERLGDFHNRCEITTIHSFLYTNILRPYAYFVKDGDGNSELNHPEVDGHDIHYSSYNKREEWLNSVDPKLRRFAGERYLLEGLQGLQWKLDAGDELCLCPKPINNTKRTKFHNVQYFPANSLTPEILKNYKRLYWVDGIIDHEDVLYFSYRLLKENERIRQFISLKFPFIFLDEFQDTNPIQTKIIKWLAEAGSKLGVIGDPAQSIYGFQGAERKDFVDFTANGLRHFKIEKNRRSTKNIIDLLNNIRNETNFKQEPLHEITGENASAWTGDNISGFIGLHKEYLGNYNKTSERPPSIVLVRTNDRATELKQIFSGKNPNSTVWPSFQEVDHKKSIFLQRVISAQELASDCHFELAIKELLKVLLPRKFSFPLKEFAYNKDKLRIRGVALDILSGLINNRTKNISVSIVEFYNDFLLPLFKRHGLEVVKITIGAIKKQESRDFLENTNIVDLVADIKLPEDKNHITTMHKSKGAEFTNVFLCLESEGELEKHILSPNIEDEECRLRYVALSRAKERIFIYTPTLSDENKQKIESLNIKVLKSGDTILIKNTNLKRFT